MTHANFDFKENIRNVMLNGKNDTGGGETIRTRWEDGEIAYSRKVFGVLNSYDLTNEFPIIDLRPTAFEAGKKELLWIYQDQSNDVELLEQKYGVKYWRQWANEDGNLGKAYGYQVFKKHEYKEGYFNQIDRLIYDLINNPYSRRMLINLYNHEELCDMTLYPCAFLTMWDFDGEYLNMTLVQRSSDWLVAGNINVTQYALLQHLIAQCCGMKAGKFNHYINNLHIYDRHIQHGAVGEMLNRYSTVGIPRLVIDDSIKNFYDFKPEHIKLEGYKPNPKLDSPLEVAL